MDKEQIIELAEKVKDRSASSEERELLFAELAEPMAEFNDFLEKHLAD